MVELASINSYITKIDFLGPEIGFETKGSKNFQSFPGAIYSIAVITLTVVLGFLFGKEIYERKLPSTSFSQELIPNSKVMLKDFPLMFTFTDNSESNINNITQILNFDLVEFIIDENGSINITVNQIEIKPCNFESFESYFLPSIKQSFSGNNNTIYCFDYKDYYFKNNFAEKDSSYINIRIRLCEQNVNGCIQTSSDYINNLLVNSLYFDSYLDSNNFTNPIQYYVKKQVIQLDNLFLKKNFISVINNQLDSDNGWMLNDDIISNFISVNQNDLKYYSISTSPNQNDRLYIILYSPNFRNKITRSYMKVQDLLAKIGGIAKFFLITMQILTYHHLKFLYYLCLKKLFTVEVKHQNKSFENVIESKDGKDFMKHSVDLDASAEPIAMKNHIKRNRVSKIEPINVNKIYYNKNEEDNQNIRNAKANDKSNCNNANENINSKLNINIHSSPILNNHQEAATKINNFILKRRETSEFSSFECLSFNISYFDYWKSFLFCKNQENKRYKKIMNSIRKLIDIKLLSKMMISVVTKEDDL